MENNKKSSDIHNIANVVAVVILLYLVFYTFEKGEALGKTIAKIGF